MNECSNEDLVETMLGLTNELLDRLGVMNVSISEFERCRNILLHKNREGYKNIRTNLYSGFRRLDEMGVDDKLINDLSSGLYLMSKSLC